MSFLALFVLFSKHQCQYFYELKLDFKLSFMVRIRLTIKYNTSFQFGSWQQVQTFLGDHIGTLNSSFPVASLLQPDDQSSFLEISVYNLIGGKTLISFRFVSFHFIVLTIIFNYPLQFQAFSSDARVKSFCPCQYGNFLARLKSIDTKRGKAKKKRYTGIRNSSANYSRQYNCLYKQGGNEHSVCFQFDRMLL